MALRQRPVDELHLSQKRNKALERLGLGLRDEVPTQQQGFSVLHPWFVEATKETEYREAAFSLHRRVLVCLLIQISLVYLAATILWVLFVSLGLVPVVRVSNIGQPIQASLLVLRVFFSAAAALIAYLVHRERVSAQLTARMLLPLTYLVAAIPMLNLARDAHEAHAEAVEVAMVYLVVYRLFVPIFPVRYVALAMWGLTGAQFAYMLYIYWHALGVHARLVCRELVKGVVLNMAGCAMGFAVERVRRRNFLGAALYKDEVQLMSSVRRDVQRLLLNTLPEPIVKEVAAGQVEIAHRYEQVTVVQADMVGFTPLSASRSAAEILQILSELFGTFDELSEAIGVHKIKTIGDAYVACAGAFPVGIGSAVTRGAADDPQVNSPAKAAERAVKMALAMQQAVIDKAMELGVDIGARIGVHTGMVMGGIIGTVRFHFDMWGNGVIGAMRMEELGAKGRVHVSNTTAALLNGSLPLENAQEMDAAFVALYHIERSYFVDATAIDLSRYTLGPQVQISEECDFMELLGSTASAVERQIDDHLQRGSEQLKASTIDGIQPLASGRFSRYLKSMSSVPSTLYWTSTGRCSSRQSNSRSSSRNSGAWHSDSWGKTPTELVASPSATAAGKPSAAGGSPFRRSNSGGVHEASTDGSVQTAPVHTDGTLGFLKQRSIIDAELQLPAIGTISAQPQRASTRYFFAEHGGSGSALATADAPAETLAKQLRDAHAYLIRQIELLSAVFLVLGVYDALHFFHTGRLLTWEAVLPLLSVRYLLIVPSCMLLRYTINRTTFRNLNQVHVACATTVAFWSIGVLALSIAAPPAVRLCITARPAPCTATLPWASAQPPSPPSAPLSLGGMAAAVNFDDGECLVAVDGDVAYCASPVASDYGQILGVIHSFFHYTLVYAQLPTLLAIGLSGSMCQLVAMVMRYRFEGNSSTEALVSAVATLIAPAFLILLSHLFGVLSYVTHRSTLRHHMVLAARQQQLLNLIQGETEQCEQLLKNILPPHLIAKLAGMVELHAKRTGGGAAGGPGGAGGLGSDPALLAQQYTDCTFLFAKIDGLTTLVNDDKADPKQVMRVLQCMFNAFDQLCDIYKVQKVRKTANEYYLVAAGLPDPKLLPTAQDRACGIAAFAFAIIGCMDVLNVELRPLGISFVLQVGMHSGAAIAGIIGHKTFQYDLCGDAVNTSARMCTYSAPGQLHVSEDSYRLLAHRYAAICRGTREIKGKGDMTTYYVLNLPSGKETEALLADRTKLRLSAPDDEAPIDKLMMTLEA